MSEYLEILAYAGFAVLVFAFAMIWRRYRERLKKDSIYLIIIPRMMSRRLPIPFREPFARLAPGRVANL
jgi:hypothetical protein